VSKVLLKGGKFIKIVEGDGGVTPAAPVSVEAEKPKAPASVPIVPEVGRSYSTPMRGLPEVPKARWTLRHPDQEGCGHTGRYYVRLPDGKAEVVAMERGFVKVKRMELRQALERAGFILWATEPE
jgi:hypothetical protein